MKQKLNTKNPIATVTFHGADRDGAAVTTTKVGGNKQCAKPSLFATILAALARLFSPACKSAKTGGIKSGVRANFNATPDAVFSCHAHPCRIEMQFLRKAKTSAGNPVNVYECPLCGRAKVVGRNVFGAPVVLSSSKSKGIKPDNWSPNAPPVTCIGFNASTQRTITRRHVPLCYARAVSMAMLAVMLLGFMSPQVLRADPALIWTQISGPWSSDFNGSFGTIAIDPTNQNSIYIASSVWGPGVFKSLDGGATWVAKNQGLPTSFLGYQPVTKIAIAPSATNIIYLSTAMDNPLFPAGTGGMWRSTDGGNTWQKVCGTQNWLLVYQLNGAVSDFCIDATNPNIVYAGVAGQGIMKTLDGGLTWAVVCPTTAPQGAADYFNVVRILPNQPNTIIASKFTDYFEDVVPNFGFFGGSEEATVPGTQGVLPGGIIESVDGGATWQPIGNPTSLSLITDIQIEKGSGILYASTCAYMTPFFIPVGNKGIFKSTNLGLSWQSVNQAQFGSLDSYTFTALQIYTSGANNCVFASGALFGIVAASTNAGNSWVRLDPCLSFACINRTGVSNNKLFTLTSAGIFAADLSPFLPPSQFVITNVTPSTLAAVPLGQTQLIKILGHGFTPSSSLTFYDGVSTYPNRIPVFVSEGELDYMIGVGPNPAQWQVNVVDHGVTSNPFNFYVVNGTATLVGLSISGPATVNENATAQFSATRLLSDGSSSAASATWSVIGNAATISSAGQLTANSVNGNQTVYVVASYTQGTITKSTTNAVTIVDLNSNPGTQTQELTVNGNFSQGGNGWQVAFNFYADNRFTVAHSAGGYAYLSNPDGSGGNNLYGEIAQYVTLPANATSIILSYWTRVTTQETGTHAYDTMTLSILDQAGNVTTIDSLSNVNANSAYQQRTFDITRFKGQRIFIDFAASTDASAPTVFRLDDISVLATTPIQATPVQMSVSGPGSVIEGHNAQFSATMIYNNGTTQTISPTWSVTGPATISSAGLLQANSVISDTSCLVTCSYTASGLTTTLSFYVTVINQTAALSYLSINGPSSLNGGLSAQLTAVAIFDDASTQATPATWSVLSGPATISSSGLVTANTVSGISAAVIGASVTLNGITKTATHTINILPVTPTPVLVSLAISGPTVVVSGNMATYSAIAKFSDNSIQVVDANWNVNSPAATMASGGVLTAGAVSAATQITITANYYSQTASQIVTIQPAVVGVAVTPGMNGTVSPNTQQTVNVGSSITFTAYPSIGFGVDQWLVNNALAQTGGAVFTLNNVNAMTSITVTFKLVSTHLTGSCITNGLFMFTATGTSGSQFILQSSTNLTTWSSCSTNTIGADGTCIITIPFQANVPQLFCRPAP